MTAYLLRRASTAPGVLSDLVICDGRMASTAPDDARVIDLQGRPTVPGLADHHIHVMAQAAAWLSLDCSPAALASGGGMAALLHAARERRPGDWLRGVGYDVAASGPLDRTVLDAMDAGPVRIQDRTGTLWMLDSVALAHVLPPDEASWPHGVERDAARRPTGVLRRLDAWLRARVPPLALDLAGLGRWLAARGVTSMTDATATNGADELAVLAAAGLPQRITAMTADPSCPTVPGVTMGPVKIVLDEAELPALDDLARTVGDAHAAGRRVAVHCVDGASLVLALASGVGPGDRIEHATVVSDDQLALVARVGVTVVVQPGLVETRGDRYLAETDRRDHPHLHRLASLSAAGIPVRAGSDAPYGPADPWTGIAAAVRRTTAAGAPFGRDEAVDAATALRLMTADPGARFDVGPWPSATRADLVVLDDDWDSLTRHPPVALTIIDGRVVHATIDGLT